MSQDVAHPETQYLDLLAHILEQGSTRIDRTGIGTKAVFGTRMRFDLEKGFPLMTTKKVFWKTAFKEMLWMISGNTNIRPLLEQNVHIWSEWPHAHYCRQTKSDMSLKDFEEKVLADPYFAALWGDLGPVYGKQWRSWRCSDGSEIDQIAEAVRLLKEDPNSRRIIIEGWNVGELSRMALPPCHKQYQFFTCPETGRLSCAMVQRSVDVFLGLPFNLANLAFFTHLMAQQTGHRPGEIVWMGMDTHIYLNHVDQVRAQMERAPKALPELKILRKPEDIFSYKIEDFEMEGYDPHPAIKAEVAV